MWGGFRKHKHDKINLNKSREPAQWTGAVFFSNCLAHQISNPHRSRTNGIMLQGTHRHCLWMGMGSYLFKTTYQVFIQHA